MYSQQEYNVHFQRTRTVYAKIEILNEYDVVIDEVNAYCVDGSINLEAENSIRRTCDLRLLLQKKYLLTQESPFWGNKRIRLYIGIKHNVTDEIIYFNLGIFVINSHNATLSNTGKEIVLKGSDKMCLLNGDVSGALLNITKISAGTPIHEAVRATIATIGGEDKYIIDEAYDANGVLLTVPYDIEKDAGDSITSILDELNNFYMNFQYYYDEDGVFRFCKRPNRSTDAVIWDFEDYDFRISSDKSSNLNNIKNRIKVWGGIQEDASQPSSEKILTNETNPNSAFTVEKWGERRFVVSEDTYSTEEMCSQRAEYELLMHTLFQEQISVSCLPIYMLDINKLVKFNSEEDGVIGNYLIKSLTIPLKPETEMSFQAYKMESDINI